MWNPCDGFHGNSVEQYASMCWNQTCNQGSKSIGLIAKDSWIIV